MGFCSKVKFSNDQLETDAEEMPAFVRAVDVRLRQEYPEYTFGTWIPFREVQWGMVAVIGAAHGFRVTFKYSAKDPTAAKLKVGRHSRILGFLMGISIVIALVFAFAMMMTGEGSFFASFMVTMIVLLFISWLLSGTIARAMGKAIAEEELQKIGRIVLETLGQVSS
jgi:hypothetical protein